MSDIAMLVAEEYERRTKHFKKAGAGGAVQVQEEIRNLNMLSLLVKVQKKELLKWVWEPKTQISIAASNSFFSA